MNNPTKPIKDLNSNKHCLANELDCNSENVLKIEELMLKEWQEVIGIFKRIEEDDFDFSMILKCKNEEVKLDFPIDSKSAKILREKLSNDLIGKKIGILRTDLENKPIVIRVLR